ncbi:hypothetical protein BJF78_30765 [Pseudonocardia sp. CNS-139]|nr:hypothetical protein BJF78_30765 [Pseudonocardia sp. CNS-139]
MWYGLLSPKRLRAGTNRPLYWLAASAFRSIARTIASRMRRSSNGAFVKLNRRNSPPSPGP